MDVVAGNVGKIFQDDEGNLFRLTDYWPGPRVRLLDLDSKQYSSLQADDPKVLGLKMLVQKA